MCKNKSAFTLIELLVVVLIIGILSAIALPQYQKAVLKSRLATVKPLVRAIADAERVFYMANNKYGYFDELDINVGGEETSRTKHTFSWGFCSLEGLNDAWDPKIQCDVSYQNGRLRYQESFTDSLRQCLTIGFTDVTDLPNRVCQGETNRTQPVGSCSSYCTYVYSN